MTLKNRVVNSLIWSSGSVIISNGVGLLVKLVLARLLTPEEFGLVGMALIFTNLIQVVAEKGLSEALIQKKKVEIREEHFHTAFWASCLLCLILYILISIIVGPFAVFFYNEEILYHLILIISLSLFIRPLAIVPIVKFTRELDFKRITYIELTSVIIGSVCAIIIAILGGGVWSLALQGVIQAIASVAMALFYSEWRPKFTFSCSAFRDIMHFSLLVIGNNTLLQISRNLDYLLIGKIFGSKLLGLYSLSFLLTDTLRQKFMLIMNKVMFPVYGKLQSNQLMIAKYYLKVIKYNCVIVFPFAAIYIIFSDQIMLFIFGEKWLPASKPLQLLSISIIVQVIGGTASSALRGIGRADLEFKISLLETFGILLPGMLIGIYYWGLSGAIMGIIFSKIISRITYQFHMRKLLNINEKDVYNAIKSPLYSMLAVLLLYEGMNITKYINSLLSLLLSVLVMVFIYAIILIWREKCILKNMHYIYKNVFVNK